MLLAPLGEAEAALDACVPPGSEARRLLNEVTLTAPELGQLALRTADHLDGFARTGKAGLEPVPVAGIVLHTALSELLRHPQDDPWDQAALLYRGMWMAVCHHLVRVRVETLDGGIWTSSRPVRLRDVLAGQERCTTARPEEAGGTYGHACLDFSISEELSRRWPWQA